MIKTNRAKDLALQLGTVSDADARVVFEEYRSRLQQEKDIKSLTKLLPFIQGTKSITGANITRLLWQSMLAGDGMRVIR